jgi:hypothetical protein
MSILRRRARPFLSLFLTLLALRAVEGPSAAQCPAPDQLDGGPCCARAFESVPFFRKVAVDSMDICWRDCGLDAVSACRAVWTPLKTLPVPGPDCSYRLARLDLLDPTGVLKWTGEMRLLYSRTWSEMKPSGAPLQVWRFLVNGTLRPSSTLGPAPCPLPPCAPVFGNVRFTGYIDYAQDCTTTAGPEIAWMLTHACDVIDHAPGFPRAGAFHPGRSYTFVGPAAGFVPAPIVASEGTLFSPLEAVRRLIHPLPGATAPIRCEFEERFGHSLAVAPVCVCSGGPPLNPQWNLGALNGTGSCGTTITTPATVPFLPGYLSLGIGSWTIPGAYPGVEDLRWSVNCSDYLEGCTGVTHSDVFFGVTTLGGYPATSVNSSGVVAFLPPTFIDMASSIRAGGATVMNVPFRSDHILNLNE